MPMQELVVPVFREAGAPERDETPLRSRRPLVYLPRRLVSPRVARNAPGAQMRALNYDQCSWIPFRGGICGAVGVAGRLPSPFTGLREHSLQVFVALG